MPRFAGLTQLMRVAIWWKRLPVLPKRQHHTGSRQRAYFTCAIAFFKSRYSSQGKMQILSRLARCSLALSN